MGYYCVKCHYKYEKEGKVPQKCPYCSTAGSIKQTASAQDLLEALDDEINTIEQSKRERARR